MKMNTPTVLIAEDDEDDKEFIMLAFKKIRSDHKLHIADNGQEAIDYLFSLPEGRMPCLIILDLNMPVLNGLQTLEALNEDPKFENIPKVIFTTSDSAEDKKRCMLQGATDYMVKSPNMTEIVKTVETMLKYC